MGVMKDFLTTIHNGGDEAVAAVQRMGDDWRAMLEQAAAEIEALRLTDAERGAVETSFDAMQYAADELGLSQADCDRLTATLRGLLERSG